MRIHVNSTNYVQTTPPVSGRASKPDEENSFESILNNKKRDEYISGQPVDGKVIINGKEMKPLETNRYKLTTAFETGINEYCGDFSITDKTTGVDTGDCQACCQ